MRILKISGVFATLVMGAPLAAQGTSSTIGDIVRSTQIPQTASASNRAQVKIPPGQLPPAGMCRIWIDGVPPGQQPAPTDCRTAVATAPANSRVIWGDQQAFPGNGKGKVKSKGGKSSDAVRGKGQGRGNDDENDDDGDENTTQAGGVGSILGSVIGTGMPTNSGLSKSNRGRGRGGE